MATTSVFAKTVSCKVFDVSRDGVTCALGQQVDAFLHKVAGERLPVGDTYLDQLIGEPASASEIGLIRRFHRIVSPQYIGRIQNSE